MFQHLKIKRSRKRFTLNETVNFLIKKNKNLMGNNITVDKYIEYQASNILKAEEKVKLVLFSEKE